LARDITENQRGHFSTGAFGTDRLLDALTDHGRADLAYTLMTQTEFPSLALMLANGSTTTWETWGEAILSQTPPGQTTPIAAVRPLSHVQFVGLDAWLLQHVAGIRRDDRQPGFKAAIIWPQLTQQIDWARASYHTVRGWIENQYTVKDGRIEMTVTIPPNTTATVYVPTTRAAAVVVTPPASVKLLRTEKDFAVYGVPSGRYHFVAERK
jgi:alpha-L-rhamnosidase